MFYVDGNEVSPEEYDLLLKAFDYPLDKFLRKVCDYEYEHPEKEAEMTAVVMQFISLKEKAIKYVQEIRKVQDVIEKFLSE